LKEDLPILPYARAPLPEDAGTAAARERLVDELEPGNGWHSRLLMRLIKFVGVLFLIGFVAMILRALVGGPLD
jgi:hypothetical protein